MAETPNINIQIDQEALREQIDKTIREALDAASLRLRFAADQLDNDRWLNDFLSHHETQLKAEYKRGFDAGRTAGGGENR